MYIGFATKCAFCPLIVMPEASSTALKFASVTRPSLVWTPVLNVTWLPL